MSAPAQLTPINPDPLLAKANMILLDTRKIKSSYGIIGNSKLLPITLSNTKENAAKLPPGKYKEYIEHTKKVDAIRIACHQAVKVNLPDESVSYQNLIENHVIADFGVGECGEKGVVAFTKAYKLGLKALRIAAVNPDNEHEKHCFNVIGYEVVLKKPYGNLTEFLNNFDQGVILDPFFQMACTVKEFTQDNKATPLKEYLSMYGVTKIVALEETPSTPYKDVAGTFSKDIATIKECAEKILAGAPSTSLRCKISEMILMLLELQNPVEKKENPLADLVSPAGLASSTPASSPPYQPAQLTQDGIP